MTFSCDLCGRSFRDNHMLLRHRARKTPCKPIIEREDLPAGAIEDPGLSTRQCRFCGRVLSSYNAMRRHVRSSCKIAPNSKNGEDGMELLYQHTIRKQEARMEALEAEMRQLRAQIAAGAPAQASSISIAQQGDGNVVAIDNSQKNITINIFGQEGVQHITARQIRSILEESLGTAGCQALPAAAQAAVLKTAMLVYSDPDHPENLTCYMPNKKTNDALVHTARPDGTVGWEVQPVSMVVTPMAQKSVDALFDNQPFEDADMFGPLMIELRDNESKYSEGRNLRPILVRNKQLLARALKTLPVALSGKEEDD